MSRGIQDPSKTNEYLQDKAKAIMVVLDEPMVDLWALRSHALSEGGLVNDVLRRRAWPKLVGLHERIWSTDTATRSVPEALVVTPKRSNVGASLPGEEKMHPRRLLSDTPDDSAQQQQTKKAQDIFRSEVQNPHYKPSQHGNSTHPTDDEDGASLSSTSSFSTSSASMQAAQRRSRLRNLAAQDKVLASSLDATQIELDVLRCTWHLLTATQKRSQQQQLANGPILEHKKRYKKIMKLIHRKQRRLSNLINLTLIQSYQKIQYHSEEFPASTSKDLTLRYYQGYHDVACIILSTLGISTSLSRWVPPPPSSVPMTAGGPTGFEMATAVLLQLSQSHLRDCMRPNFAQLQIVLRLTLFPLLAYFDRTVHEYLVQCNMMEPYFALSWIITWFSHDVRDTELVKRLFDFFIVSHPLMPIYVAIAMICHPFNRQDVLQCECDFSIVHQTLSSLPRNSSMVGWKYRPMDGQYVSDDENDGDSDEDDDEDLLSIGPMGSQSSVDTEFLLHEAATLKHTNKGGGDQVVADAEAVSIVSSSMSSLYTARVPFQELLDMALQFMERLPPRNLIRLATRYYGREYVQSELNIQSNISKMNSHASAPSCSNDITFLQPPPTWTRSFTAHSDQTLKYYRSRRALLTADPDTLDQPLLPKADEHAANDTIPTLLLKDPSKRWAVIAAGYGPGDDAARRRRKRRKRLLLLTGTAVAVAIVAVIWQRAKTDTSSGISSNRATVSNASCPTHDRWTPPKLMATSAGETRPPPTVKPMRNSKIDSLPECKMQPNPFDKKCPSAGVLVEEHRIASPRWMLQPDDKNGIVAKRSVSDRETVLVVESMHELSHVVLPIVQGVSQKVQMLRNQLQQIGGAIFLASWKNYVVQSRLWIEMTQSMWIQKLQDLPKLGTAMAAVRAKFGHLLLGVQGLRKSAEEFQQSVSTKTSKVMKDAKSALQLAHTIEFDNGSSTTKNSMSTTPSIIQALEKEFQPPSLQVVSKSVHLLVQNLVHLPLVQLILELKSFGEIQKEQLVHLMASIAAQFSQLVQAAEANGQQIAKLEAFCRAFQVQIATALGHFYAEQGLNLKDIAPSEMLGTVRNKVMNAVHSPAVRKAIRGASIFDQYSSTSSQHVYDSPEVVTSQSDIEDATMTNQRTEEQCISEPFTFDDLTIFD